MTEQTLRYTSKRRYFIDTEFIEDGKTIDLISLGIVTDDGRAWYGVSTEADLSRASPWVSENVLPHLPQTDDPAWMTRAEIRDQVTAFVRADEPAEMWGYYADYDWVALCQLFGTMMDLPKHFPMFCMDLKQLSVMLGSPRHPVEPKDEHNALADARWNKLLFEALLQYEQPR